MLEGHADRDIARRRIGVQLAQLQGDALAQAAGADAGRLERLHRREHALDVLVARLDLGLQAQADFLEIVVQIAVVGDRIGDHAGDGEIDGRELGELELLDELLLQRLPVLVAEVAAPVLAGPGTVRGAARLLAPRLVGDLDLGLLALIGGGDGVTVELGVLLLDRRRLFARALGRGLERRIERGIERELVLGLEHHVGLEGLAHVGLQIERGELQQPDGLLQLRRHGELLADTELQTWLQHGYSRSKPTI